MATLLTVLALGFFLGMRHATDPDHVVAVTTIVSRERTMRHATLIGALWGVGHTATILMVGSAIIVFKLTIPPRVGLGMELSVAFMLILLGLLNLTGLTRRIFDWFALTSSGADLHSHGNSGGLIAHGIHAEHRHSENMPVQMVAPDSSVGSRRDGFAKLGLFHIARPLTVGVVHGLAGSAAVALLVLTTISRPSWAIGYLLIFGLGTIAGMMLITAAIALPFAYTMKHFLSLNKALAMASGFVSVCFGLFLCYQIGFVDGLFTSHPNWMPH